MHDVWAPWLICRWGAQHPESPAFLLLGRKPCNTYNLKNLVERNVIMTSYTRPAIVASYNLGSLLRNAAADFGSCYNIYS